MTVKFFTTSRLAAKYCQGGCQLRKECAPSTTDSKEGDMSGLNILVVGQIVASECPIMARIWPFSGWIDAKNHKGRCGEQER